MDYMTPKEAGDLWGVSERRVQYLCANNQVLGAQRLGGKVWVIPKETPKPVDGRTKAAKQEVLRPKAMLSHEKIVDAVKKATSEFPLTKVEYFGSYADGEATEDSDLDLLVEFDKPSVSILTLISLKHFLEKELLKPVDVIHATIPTGSIIEIGKTVSVI